MVGDHSSKQYDQELEAIRSKVLLMGGMVETQFDEALEAFRVGNVEQADKVMADDQAVNQLEVQLDDACSHLIVRRQPAANDLRTVMATIKVITDLERIGDEAAKIARTAKSLHERGMVSFNHYETVRTISRATADMLHDALDAFARLDGKAAVQIIAQDDVIDHEFRTIMRSTITFMMEDPRTISSALDVLWVAKAIERIGDEAAKIARTAKSLHERGMVSFNHYETVRTISRATADMLHDALDAFARLDGKAAVQIIAQDDVIDHEFRTIMRSTITFMMEDPRTISSALDVLWVAKAIERIGDHAKNIAEYVIYVVEGRDIRHSKPNGAAVAAPGEG